MMTKSRSGAVAIRSRVREQGVERPFETLLRMPEEGRLLLGQLLGCDLREGSPPEEQAWRLINQNLRGLQARTHHLPEQLSPFARNNNWWEIVTRTARRCGLRFYPGLKDEEVENLLFDHFAGQVLKRERMGEGDLDRLARRLHPTLAAAIRSLGLSAAARQALVAALLQGLASDQDEREGLNRLTDWLRSALPWSWTTSVSQGLALLQQRLCDMWRVWILQGARTFARSNYGKVATALAMIHLASRIEHAREQFELLGS
ncbi:MAG: hypothetical protein Fur0037_21430 [Planctomycetota bacterium]